MLIGDSKLYISVNVSVNGRLFVLALCQAGDLSRAYPASPYGSWDSQPKYKKRMDGFILDYFVILWVFVLAGAKVMCLFFYSNDTFIQHFIPHTSNT